jgi:uncharacterized protein YuzE
MFFYDDTYDILYLSISPNEPAFTKEMPGNINIRYSIKTPNKLVGVTIFDFQTRFLNNGNLEEMLEFINSREKN